MNRTRQEQEEHDQAAIAHRQAWEAKNGPVWPDRQQHSSPRRRPRSPGRYEYNTGSTSGSNTSPWTVEPPWRQASRIMSESIARDTTPTVGAPHQPDRPPPGWLNSTITPRTSLPTTPAAPPAGIHDGLKHVPKSSGSTRRGSMSSFDDICSQRTQDGVTNPWKHLEVPKHQLAEQKLAEARYNSHKTDKFVDTNALLPANPPHIDNDH